MCVVSLGGDERPRVQSMSRPDRSAPTYQVAVLSRPFNPRSDALWPRCWASEGTVAKAFRDVFRSHMETRTVSQGKLASICASCHSTNSRINSVGQITAGPATPSFSIHDSPRCRALCTEPEFV